MSAGSAGAVGLTRPALAAGRRRWIHLRQDHLLDLLRRANAHECLGHHRPFPLNTSALGPVAPLAGQSLQAPRGRLGRASDPGAGQSAVVTTWVVVWPGSCWLVSSGFGELGEYQVDVVGRVCGAYDAVSMPSLAGRQGRDGRKAGRLRLTGTAVLNLVKRWRSPRDKRVGARGRPGAGRAYVWPSGSVRRRWPRASWDWVSPARAAPYPTSQPRDCLSVVAWSMRPAPEGSSIFFPR